MPWTVRRSDECPESRPWAVVKDDGAVEGCHATETAANTQRAALYAQEEDKALVRTSFKAVATVTDTGEFEAVISTENVDREKDIVAAPAMVAALSNWNRPIPLAWNHSTAPEHIFGHIDPVSVKDTDGEVVAAGQVDLESDVGKEAWRSFKNRSIGFSFGYMILASSKRKGGGRHITELDVFEVTATPTPMNNHTRVLSTKAVDQLAHEGEKPKTDEELRELAKQVEREVVEEQHPELQGPPESGPSPEEKRMAELEGKVDALLETLPGLVKKAVDEQVKTVVEHTSGPSDVKDPLRKHAEELALEVASGGMSSQPPPEPVEEPVQELPELKELKRKSRELALGILIGNQDHENERNSA